MQLRSIVLCHSCSAPFREVFKNVNKFRLLLVHHGGGSEMSSAKD